MAKRKPIFVADFDSVESVNQAFQEGKYDYPTSTYVYDREFVTEKELLFAWYGQRSYDGSAFVLFRRDGKLYEVNGGHCSCYGLENQWRPEETSKKALLHRIEKGRLGKGDYVGEQFAQQLLELLSTIREKVNV